MNKILLSCCLAGAMQLALAAAPQPPAASASPSSGLSGKVVETMNTAGYTYVRIDTGKEKVWAAAPQFQVKVGDRVAASGAMPMRNYHSKTLDRDFDLVYFTGEMTVNGGPASAGTTVPELPKGHPPINAPAPSAPEPQLKGITKAAGGKTVEEIYASKTKLKDQTTSVRGRVVKYNANIMGKNWVHVRDGTGAAGSNDLLVTTTDRTKVGDLVLVTGKVGLNRDFGANYKYAVLIEDAKVMVE